MEWATETQAAAIPLFRHVPQHRPNQLRLEHIVFASAQLPFDLEWSGQDVVESPLGICLPFDALLSHLYSRCQVGRSIFTVLAELTELVQLRGSVLRPVATSGLLIPEAEQKGFVLNATFSENERICVEIGWRPPSRGYVFHTCLCDFGLNQGESIAPGIWKPAGVIGVGQPLTRALRTLFPGAPSTLITAKGRSFIQAQAAARRTTAVPG